MTYFDADTIAYHFSSILYVPFIGNVTEPTRTGNNAAPSANSTSKTFGTNQGTSLL